MTLSVPSILWVPILSFVLGFFWRPFYEKSVLKDWNNLFESWLFCDDDFKEKKKALLNKRKASKM
ncbi:hypothetical protein [Companilactobacillus bobalius]|uniref:Uncharacterized protein n=1 Tax=Companilactobacillus bobalius TaxID=2801451 RepID=A0A202F7V3_9LACO|nr:hypothetical protein [Companilactobacillus bobalius]KAE9557549.1 hypothetical protein ATN92_15455 [Companilactobacillus bobalius]KAE9563695.1 hypothetical protein ATN92_02905 [Companilactobacillus bobalius]OVE96518.1 hypothetical protein LKACC16343_02185 [Companilactobacillus bobalius]GEO58507.1 hypothetical protein LBO01_16360 [Companilactobacillus paralimentarius]